MGATFVMPSLPLPPFLHKNSTLEYRAKYMVKCIADKRGICRQVSTSRNSASLFREEQPCER